jgi:hypothetical protein
LKEKASEENDVLARAALALAWRKRVDLLGILFGILESHNAAERAYEYGSLLSAATYLVRCAGPAERENLARVLAPNLSRTDGSSVSDILWSAWSADLRSLGPEIEKIATMGPGEEEAQHGRRYHLARKIVALWREEDLATRGKLLIAFGLADRSFFDSEAQERGEQMRETLGQLARDVSPDELAAISNFLAWCESDVVGHNPHGYREAEENFVRLAKEALGLPSR